MPERTTIEEFVPTGDRDLELEEHKRTNGDPRGRTGNGSAERPRSGRSSARGLVTRWTKLNAIKAIVALEVPDRWRRIWQFARDLDYAVRQAASIALERDAWTAYRSLKTDIEHLLMRAAARRARDRSIEKATISEDTEPPHRGDYYIGDW